MTTELRDQDICWKCHLVLPDAPALDALLAEQKLTRDNCGPVVCQGHEIRGQRRARSARLPYKEA